MKKLYSLLVFTSLLISCKSNNKTEDVKEIIEQERVTEELAYASYGKTINDDDALTSDRMMAHYDAMEVGDTINVKMLGKITDVCVKKGCWMKLDMGNDKVVRVTFKDYGFFVPTDASGAITNI